MTGDVLDQRAAERDVEELKATTDPEHRKITVECLAREIQLERVPLRRQVLADARLIGRAVPLGRDVAATGETHTLDVRPHGRAGLDDDDLRSRLLERANVARARRGGLGCGEDRRGQRDPRPLPHRVHGTGDDRRLARSMSSTSTPSAARGCRKATMPSAPRRGTRSTTSTPAATS